MYFRTVKRFCRCIVAGVSQKTRANVPPLLQNCRFLGEYKRLFDWLYFSLCPIITIINVSVP